ncbi:MAG: methyltransferase domain-containing protein [Acidobacteria bacterium]|nr:methyltransferase domain-containing protein [Acidobacteriota bacterium]
MNEYNAAYAAHKDFFGAEPEPLLVNYADRIAHSHPVLDAGAGQGRNSFFLARQGVQVIAMDTSVQSTTFLQEVATEEKLPVSVVHGNVLNFESKQPLSATLLFGLFQLLSKTDIQLLISRIRAWTAPGGFVFVTAFSTEDTGIQMLSEEWEEAEPHSFHNGRGDAQTWLEPNEILALFQGAKVLHHFEGPGQWHRHGNGPLEQHSMIEAVFQLKDK